MWTTYFESLALILLMALAGWVFSLSRRNVSIVDSMWSLFFLLAALYFAWKAPELNNRGFIILCLVALWSLRLSIHLTIRNWGKPEDRRYEEIRRNNEPHFELKSLYIIFGLQALLAWIICVPLLASLYQPVAFSSVDAFAITLFFIGLVFEVVADAQLLKFQRSKNVARVVLQSGLWRYSRHPNYFGEFCVWWSFYLLAVPAGGWWTIYAPLLMSFLLLKVSGVGLMERNIESRRPEYAAYTNRTNAFFPWFPKRASHPVSEASH